MYILVTRFWIRQRTGREREHSPYIHCTAVLECSLLTNDDKYILVLELSVMRNLAEDYAYNT